MSETIIQSERSPSGPEKAAALLLMMGKPPAAGSSSTSIRPIYEPLRERPQDLALSSRQCLIALSTNSRPTSPPAPICSAISARPATCWLSAPAQ